MTYRLVPKPGGLYSDSTLITIDQDLAYLLDGDSHDRDCRDWCPRNEVLIEAIPDELTLEKSA